MLWRSANELEITAGLLPSQIALCRAVKAEASA
jgi:hypothetical protein